MASAFVMPHHESDPLARYPCRNSARFRLVQTPASESRPCWSSFRYRGVHGQLGYVSGPRGICMLSTKTDNTAGAAVVTWNRIFTFLNSVNEVSARLVAAGVGGGREDEADRPGSCLRLRSVGRSTDCSPPVGRRRVFGSGLRPVPGLQSLRSAHEDRRHSLRRLRKMHQHPALKRRSSLTGS